ncbi:MAG TPA: glycosyltransferase family 2 protein [Pirellulales bacterium]|nr:glycosyltransferase family 2 protein [Pirellulales bacterium]
MPQVDIVIPVYNEGDNIGRVLDTFVAKVRSSYRVLICYDRDDDNTLEALERWPQRGRCEIELVKNRGRGAHGAVMSGIERSTAPLVLTYPADDTFNAGHIDAMLALGEQGCDIVAASRFMPGGCMTGAPWLKATLVRAAAFTLYHLARLPTRDASNGLRMFSRRLVEQVPVESTAGFCYSIEWLVKCHRLGWRVGEVPSQWFERNSGQSRFRVLKWLPHYLRWYRYAFATTYLRARSVTLREPLVTRA